MTLSAPPTLDGNVVSASAEAESLQTTACCSTAPAANAGSSPGATLQSPKMSLIEEYQPIFVIAGGAVLGGIVLAVSSGDPARFMSGAMGFFLLPLAMLKLFDIRGFATAFARYDIVTQAWRPYGWIYPFLELGLAMAFIGGFWPTATYATTLIIMGVGAIGILRVLARGEKLQCACVGTRISVPLGGVSIAENVGMAAMSAIMLLIAL